MQQNIVEFKIKAKYAHSHSCYIEGVQEAEHLPAYQNGISFTEFIFCTRWHIGTVAGWRRVRLSACPNSSVHQSVNSILEGDLI
jgi:hypothetical protein